MTIAKIVFSVMCCIPLLILIYICLKDLVNRIK